MQSILGSMSHPSPYAESRPALRLATHRKQREVKDLGIGPQGDATQPYGNDVGTMPACQGETGRFVSA
jgi:hypothetical protein